MKIMHNQSISDMDIAIIGMSGRFPGSRNIHEFWSHLCEGVEGVVPVTDEEFTEELHKVFGSLPKEALAKLQADPHYVRAAAGIEDIDLFDAAFFGYNASEAEVLDPQQRIFLESAWEAMEDAGYSSDEYQGLVGVYAGAEVTPYHTVHHTSLLPSERDLVTLLGNEGGYLTTRVSYKLNLTGPSFSIHSACSTSLVAVHVACQSLRNGECDLALAGGVIAFPLQKAGYVYQEGSIFSPDGHCRTFDAQAQGSVFAYGGVGVIVLKSLADAVHDGDHVYAVIKGSAVNNDGAFKTGYTAPSIEGQRRMLSEALAVADIEPDTLGYIEAHGTGTPLGDPIEIAALTQAFQRRTAKKNFCAIGSVKSNIGHLGVAAGVAGLIKTTLALKHKTLPPSLHYQHTNPQIDFANSPFYVNTECREWQQASDMPRRAGVSSLGIGGTNAHVILEEAPEFEPASSARPYQLVTLSAKTPTALEAMTARLVDYVEQYPETSLPDLAFTLQMGRKSFPYKRMLVCQNSDILLETLKARQSYSAYSESGTRSVAFLFSGQGAQYPQMARELYELEAPFREQVDQCAEILRPYLHLDLREVLYPSEQHVAEAQERLKQTSLTQPALFVVEYALAKLWMQWGVRPQAMLGHSIGEYVAACLAGVFSLEDALKLVALRGRLMQELPAGAMLSVALSEKELQEYLTSSLSLAAINGERSCVVSGPTPEIDELEKRLVAQDISCRRLQTSHAFHSAMMEPVLERFAAEVSTLALHAPQIPYISNLTGTWIREEEARDPNYWTQHLRQTVRFADGLQTLFEEPEMVLLEVGPGRTLATFATRHASRGEKHIVLSSLRHPQDLISDISFLLNTSGRLWCAGVALRWRAFHAQWPRQRLSLPAYPFERKRYWTFAQALQGAASVEAGKKPDIADWFSVPSWKRSILPTSGETPVQENWLIFVDALEMGTNLAKQIERDGDTLVRVMMGERYSRLDRLTYTLDPSRGEDYVLLFKELAASDLLPTQILHLWTLADLEQIPSEREFFETAQVSGFFSLLFLAQALGALQITHPLQLFVVSNNLQEVIGGDLLCPVRATVWGPGKVIPYEYSNITCRHLDIILPVSNADRQRLQQQLLAECRTRSTEMFVAYRGKHRWVQGIEPVRIEALPDSQLPLKRHGVYLITGGLGGIGSIIAGYLAREVQAKLVLVGRSVLPSRADWQDWLSTHETHDRTSRSIQQVLQLESDGAEVLVVSADVTRYEEMQELLQRVSRRFGSIHGVIHAAGTLNAGMMQLKSSEAALEVLAPRVQGALILDELLGDTQLDFFVLCSSLFAITGGIGQVDYCAGNVFLDSFAFARTARTGTPTLAINWDAWQEVGMAVEASRAGGKSKHLLPFLKDTILSREGIEVFKRVLAFRASPQMIVSTRDLKLLIEQQKNQEFLIDVEGDTELQDARSVSLRPDQQAAFVAPRNEIEQQIATIWQSVLRIDNIGVCSNFFELGGDSVMVIKIIKRLHEAFQLNLVLSVFFANPTIEGLAQVIVEKQLEQVDQSQLAMLLQDISQMSEEEAMLVLSKKLSE